MKVDIIKDKLNEIVTKFESPTELSHTPNNGLNLLPLDSKENILNAIKLFSEVEFENSRLKQSAAFLIAMLALNYGIDIDINSDIWNAANIPESKPEEKDMSLGGGGISLPSI